MKEIRSTPSKEEKSMASTFTVFNLPNASSAIVASKCSHETRLKRLLHYVHPSTSTPSLVYGDKMNRKREKLFDITLQCNSRLLARAQCAAKKGIITAQGKKSYEFFDDVAEVELRIPLQEETIPTAEEVFVDVQDTSLVVAVQILKEVKVLLSINRLYGQIKPADTVWYIDEDELVVNLKKHDVEVKWPDIMEHWNSLTTGVSTLLKGTSVFLVGDSTEINWAVARELAAGLQYTPLQTSQLLEQVTKKSLHSLVVDEGENSVAEAEAAILESISTHVRVVVATLGGRQGAASRPAKWRSLHAGFTVWLSQSQAKDEASAEEEAKKAKQCEGHAYAKADVVVMLGGWDANSGQPAAEGCLRALKYLIESEKELPGKKNLYIRLGCRGDWPNIKPPGWDPLQKNAIEATAINH